MLDNALERFIFVQCLCYFSAETISDQMYSNLFIQSCMFGWIFKLIAMHHGDFFNAKDVTLNCPKDNILKSRTRMLPKFWNSLHIENAHMIPMMLPFFFTHCFSLFTLLFLNRVWFYWVIFFLFVSSLWAFRCLGSCFLHGFLPFRPGKDCTDTPVCGSRPFKII